MNDQSTLVLESMVHSSTINITPTGEPAPVVQMKQLRLTHAIITLTICAFGLIINIITVCISVNRQIRHGTNLIILTIGICDFIILTTTPPKIIYFDILGNSMYSSVEWLYFRMYQASIAVTARVLSLYLTAAMTVYRLVLLRRQYIFDKQKDNQNICTTIAVVVTTMTATTLPNFFQYKLVKQHGVAPMENMLTLESSPKYNRVIFWLNGIVFKIIPCLILLISSMGIIWVLKKCPKTKNKSKLRNGRNIKRIKRTTRLTVIITTITLLCELPHAIISILAGTSATYFQTIYATIGNTIDLLAMVNFTCVFACYIYMNGEYRKMICRFLPLVYIPTSGQQPSIMDMNQLTTTK